MASLGRQGIIMPPVNFVALVNLLDSNTWHSKSVRTKAKDTIGHGWDLESDVDDEGNVTGSEENKLKLWKFFEEAALQSGETITDIVNRILIDYDTIGNAYMEIIRADRNDGEPVGLAHVPGDTLYSHQDGKRILQRVGAKTVWFKRTGIDGILNKDTGLFDNGTPFEQTATELIHWKDYSPRSEHYGLPGILPAVGAILGDMSQRDYNIKFFENYAIPQYAVIVENGDLDEETRATVKDYFATKVKDEPHSTLVLTVPAAEPGQEAVKIRFEKLAVDVREASFRLYRQDVRNEILAAHAVPPYRLGLAETGALSSTNINIANQIYKFQEIDPRRMMIEHKINLFVVRQGFGITDWVWRLNELDVSDRVADADYYTKLADSAFITPNEGREAAGFDKSEDPAMDMHYYRGIALADRAMATQDRAREIVNEDEAAAAQQGLSK